MNWNYNPEQYEEKSFSLIPKGDHRVRIEEVTPKTSKAGNEYYEITLEVSGHNAKLWYNLVFLPQEPQKTNQRLGELFTSFGITDYNVNNYHTWIGKVGACRVKHEKRDGYDDRAVVAYLLSPSKAEKLPPWKEPENGRMANASGGSGDTWQQVDGDTPW